MKHFSIVFFLVLLILLASTSFAQINWTKHPYSVLGPGPVGSWDDMNVGLACVSLYNDTLHMWYDGNWDNSGSVNAGIGHATSVDGINWIRDTLNPVLTPGPSNWDTYIVSQAAVLFNASDSLFHMWYMASAGVSGPLYIGHATSPTPNGRNWTKDANPALSPGNWDNYGPNSPTVVLVNDTLHLLYAGFHIEPYSVRIGHATSIDWMTWQKDPANPVLYPGGVQDWDYLRAWCSKVIYDGFRFHLFYTAGESFPNKKVGYAQSNDGSHWIKYDDSTTTDVEYMNSDPVLIEGPGGSWDDDGVWPGSVLFNDSGDSLRMWYSGISNGIITAKIGYATSFFYPPDLTTAIGVISQNFPYGYELHQNYPNPFNPSTTIEFTLLKPEYVELNIYNILGKEVAELVSDNLPAAVHQYQFNGSELASGIYYYQLVAGDYREVKKMILLK